MTKPLTEQELREKNHFILVRQHGDYSFYIGLFNRFKIEKAGQIVTGGTDLTYGIIDFNNKTGLETLEQLDNRRLLQ